MSVIILFTIIIIPLSANLKSPDEFKLANNNDKTRLQAASPFVIPVHFLVRFYQVVLSPIKQENCRLYPSCSHYSILSLKKNGFIGVFMTVDRLNRCGHDLQYYEKIIVDNRIKYYDPVRKK